jgi:tetratricopeptide (TPR) repeat protein
MTYEERKKNAVRLIKEDSYPEAFIEFSILYKENPSDEDVRNAITFLFSRIQEGNFDFTPVTAEEFSMRGIAAFYHQAYPESIADLTKAIELDPAYDYAYKSRAFSYLATGRINEGIEDLKKAININPTGEFFDNLAEFYSQTGEIDKALEYYKKAVAASPDDPRLWYNYGVQLGESGNAKEALAKFDKAIELWPQYEDALVNRKFILENYKHLL